MTTFKFNALPRDKSGICIHMACQQNINIYHNPDNLDKNTMLKELKRVYFDSFGVVPRIPVLQKVISSTKMGDVETILADLYFYLPVKSTQQENHRFMQNLDLTFRKFQIKNKAEILN